MILLNIKTGHSVKTALFVVSLFISSSLWAQVKIGDNPSSINANSLLELESSDKGVLIPRIALSSSSSASPLSVHVPGMVVYNTATSGSGTTAVSPGFYYNDGEKWIKVADSNGLDYTNDAWVNNASNGNIELGTQSDGTTARTAGTEFVALDNGNVGVGTDAPAAKLQVVDDNLTEPMLSLKGDLVNERRTLNVYPMGSANTPTVMADAHISSGSDGVQSLFGTLIEGPDLGNTVFQTRDNDPTDGFYFVNRSGNQIALAVRPNNDSGRVGIGTVAPSARLHVAGAGNVKIGSAGTIGTGVVNSILAGSNNSLSGSYSIVSGFDNVVDGSKSLVCGVRDTVGSPLSYVFGDQHNVQGIVTFCAGTGNRITSGYGYVIGSSSSAGAFHATAIGRNAHADHIGSFVFSNGANLSSSNNNQFSAAFGGGYRLFTKGNLATGVSLANASSSWTSISDRRSKENIAALDYGLNEVMLLQPSKYNYKGNENLSLGFIAQEMQEVIPEVVEKTNMGPDNDYLGVKYTELISVLTRAIQELNIELQELKQQVEVLKEENESLKK